MIDELKNIKADGSLISEGCLSFVDESTFAIAAIDEDFEELMEACGAGTAPEVDTDSEDKDVATSESAEVITESAKEKVVGFVQSIWARIKGAFEKVTSWIKEKIADVKKKNYDKLMAKFDKADFKSDTKIGKLHPNREIGNTKWMKVLEDASIQYQTEPDKLNDLPSQIVDATVMGGKSSKNSRADVKTMRSMLKEAFLGEEITVTGGNLSTVKGDIDAIVKGSAMSDVKKQYNESRKLINEMIRELKKEKKASDDKDAKKEIAGSANVARRVGQLLYTCHMVQFDAIRQQLSEAYGICARVAIHVNKKEKKSEETKATKESVEIFAW